MQQYYCKSFIHLAQRLNIVPIHHQRVEAEALQTCLVGVHVVLERGGLRLSWGGKFNQDLWIKQLEYY